jgi:putative pyruvate formate lyase activating enzyme
MRNDKTGRGGFCRETHQMKVAHVGPHFGEEPPITGEKGSGTVFFTGCSLKCAYCQNHQISREGLGRTMDAAGLFDAVAGMIRKYGVHNVNLVSPDHFFPHAFELTTRLRAAGFGLPVVLNLSGYQSVSMLRLAEPYADIYLPDYKYADPALSLKYSKCGDYPETALNAISEMVRQKGFQGIIVRHLILPGHMDNSLNALTSLFLEFGSGLPLSLMSQYFPVTPQGPAPMNRLTTRDEFERVYAHALDLGFEHLYVQFPEEEPDPSPGTPPFVPDFRRESPFQSSDTKLDRDPGFPYTRIKKKLSKNKF